MADLLSLSDLLAAGCAAYGECGRAADEGDEALRSLWRVGACRWPVTRKWVRARTTATVGVPADGRGRLRGTGSGVLVGMVRTQRSPTGRRVRSAPMTCDLGTAAEATTSVRVPGGRAGSRAATAAHHVGPVLAGRTGGAMLTTAGGRTHRSVGTVARAGGVVRGSTTVVMADRDAPIGIDTAISPLAHVADTIVVTTSVTIVAMIEGHGAIDPSAVHARGTAHRRPSGPAGIRASSRRCRRTLPARSSTGPSGASCAL